MWSRDIYENQVSLRTLSPGLTRPFNQIYKRQQASVRSVTQSCLTLCNPMDRNKPGLPVHHRLLEPTQTHIHESMMSSSHLILCRPLLLLSSIFPSIRVFSNESALRIRWPKYWSLNFNISPSNEYSILISFRMDWLDCLVVQGTLKILLKHQSSKASVLRHSAFFMVQLSHRRTFVSKVMSLLFNMHSRLVIAFLPRSTHHLISWLQSPSSVIWEPKKKKSLTVSIVSPSICHEMMGPDAMIWSHHCHWFFECKILSQIFHSPLSLSLGSKPSPQYKKRGTLDIQLSYECCKRTW